MSSLSRGPTAETHFRNTITSAVMAAVHCLPDPSTPEQRQDVTRRTVEALKKCPEFIEAMCEVIRERLEEKLQQKELRAQKEQRADFINAKMQAADALDPNSPEYAADIRSLGLDRSTEKALRGAEINSIDDLAARTAEELRSIPNIKIDRKISIEEALQKIGKALRPPVTKPVSHF